VSARTLLDRYQKLSRCAAGRPVVDRPALAVHCVDLLQDRGELADTLEIGFAKFGSQLVALVFRGVVARQPALDFLVLQDLPVTGLEPVQ
jgi:hypothetical protein